MSLKARSPNPTKAEPSIKMSESVKEVEKPSANPILAKFGMLNQASTKIFTGVSISGKRNINSSLGLISKEKLEESKNLIMPLKRRSLNEFAKVKKEETEADSLERSHADLVKELKSIGLLPKDGKLDNQLKIVMSL